MVSNKFTKGPKRLVTIGFISILNFSISYAYEVWIGTSCTPHNAAVKPNTWSRAAKAVVGLNINFAPLSPAAGTPGEGETACSSTDWRTIMSKYNSNATGNGMVAIARSSIQSPTKPDKPVISQHLNDIYSVARSFGYDIGSLMFYNNADPNGVRYDWTVEEVQEMRNWLDSNGHANVSLMFDARNNFASTRTWCQNPLVNDILLEAEPSKFYDNDGARQTLLKWLWSNSATKNKKFIFQMPVNNVATPYGTPSGYQEIRRMVQWMAEFMGKDFVQSSQVIFLPATYNPGFTFYPELENESTYANTLTSIALSLVEQKDIFECRSRMSTHADADSYVRTASDNVVQTINFPNFQIKTIKDADFAPGAVSSSNLVITYKSSNINVATIIGGKIHITGIGKTIITASQLGNNIYAAAAVVERELIVKDVITSIGIEADLQNSETIIYPNPFNERIDITLPQDATVEMTDYTGKVILTASNIGFIETNQLNSGVYLVRVSSSKGIHTEKLIKQ